MPKIRGRLRGKLPPTRPDLFRPAVYNGPPATPGHVYHYCTSHAARKITQAGVLEPRAQENIVRLRPWLWASKNHVFEPASLHPIAQQTWECNGVVLPKCHTFQSAQSYGTQLVRFVLREEDFPYDHWHACTLAGLSTQQARLLALGGTRKGSDIRQHRVTFDPIPAEDWLSIDMWNRSTCQWDTVWTP